MPKLEPKTVQRELDQGQLWPVYWLYGGEAMKARELLKGGNSLGTREATKFSLVAGGHGDVGAAVAGINVEVAIQIANVEKFFNVVSGNVALVLELAYRRFRAIAGVSFRHRGLKGRNVFVRLDVSYVGHCGLFFPGFFLERFFPMGCWRCMGLGSISIIVGSLPAMGNFPRRASLSSRSLAA